MLPNVQVLDKSSVAGRVGYKFVDGKKVRYNKKIQAVLTNEGKEKYNG